MVLTLQQLCYINLANQINDAPPGIQETIIGETKKSMEERITKEVVARQIQNIYDSLVYMIPDIMENLIHVTITPGSLRDNYEAIYASIHPSLIHCAVHTAEEAVRRMEQRYVHNAFNIHNYYYDESEDDQDSEGMYM